MLPGLSGLKRSIKSFSVFGADVKPPTNGKTFLKNPGGLASGKSYFGEKVSGRAWSVGACLDPGCLFDIVVLDDLSLTIDLAVIWAERVMADNFSPAIEFFSRGFGASPASAGLALFLLPVSLTGFFAFCHWRCDNKIST